MPQIVASDQGLHCLQLNLQFIIQINRSQMAFDQGLHCLQLNQQFLYRPMGSQMDLFKSVGQVL